MKFEVVPILSTMKELYQQPRSPERFNTYLSKLQGSSKGDMRLPIAGFNPMAKEHVLEKIERLEALRAEDVMEASLQEIDLKPLSSRNETIQVVLNLADDWKGGWTNRYTTDFDSKFKIHAFVTRHFCAPYFWTSEDYDFSLIRERTLAYAYRTIYWLKHSKLRTLEDHLNQEIFVQSHLKSPSDQVKDRGLDQLAEFYSKHATAEGYAIIFNFFYGDDASALLNYPCYGITQANGFEYARALTKNKVSS